MEHKFPQWNSRGHCIGGRFEVEYELWLYILNNLSFANL